MVGIGQRRQPHTSGSLRFCCHCHEAKLQDSFTIPVPRPGECGLRVPCPTVRRTRQVSRKDVPVLVYRAKPYTPRGSAGLHVPALLLSQLFLCIFARKMLTLPNKPLYSSNLCCLTFDSPLLSVSATFAGQTKGPRKRPQLRLARKRMRPAFHSSLQADGSPFPGAELWKIKQAYGAIRTSQPPLLLNCQPLSKHSFPAMGPSTLVGSGEPGRREALKSLC